MKLVVLLWVGDVWISDSCRGDSTSRCGRDRGRGGRDWGGCHLKIMIDDDIKDNYDDDIKDSYDDDIKDNYDDDIKESMMMTLKTVMMMTLRTVMKIFMLMLWMSRPWSRLLLDPLALLSEK